MKSILLIAAFSALAFTLKAQKAASAKSDTAIFATVQIQPSYPGGTFAFYKFISNNIKPVDDRGTVYIKFVVEKDGTVSHIKAVQGFSENAKKEAIRVVSLSPKWEPGMQKGEVVRCYYTVPVIFKQ